MFDRIKSLIVSIRNKALQGYSKFITAITLFTTGTLIFISIGQNDEWQYKFIDQYGDTQTVEITVPEKYQLFLNDTVSVLKLDSLIKYNEPEARRLIDSVYNQLWLPWYIKSSLGDTLITVGLGRSDAQYKRFIYLFSSDTIEYNTDSLIINLFEERANRPLRGIVWVKKDTIGYKVGTGYEIE